MESLARLFIAANELVEAEGRVLKSQVARLLLAASVGIGVVFLVLVGIGYLQYSLYRALSDSLSPATAALIVGGSSIILALIGVLYIRALLKSGPKSKRAPEQASLTDAKAKLVSAANDADPLEALADEPFTLVGIAIALGALMGLTEGRLNALSYLVRSFSWIFDKSLWPQPAPAPEKSTPNDPPESPPPTV